jgi:hypothetical protein
MFQHALDDAICAPPVFGDLFQITGQHPDRLIDLDTLVAAEFSETGAAACFNSSSSAFASLRSSVSKPSVNQHRPPRSPRQFFRGLPQSPGQAFGMRRKVLEQPSHCPKIAHHPGAMREQPQCPAEHQAIEPRQCADDILGILR